MTLYFDARVAPDDAMIREQYLRVSLPGGNWSIRGGEFFLPKIDIAARQRCRVGRLADRIFGRFGLSCIAA